MVDEEYASPEYGAGVQVEAAREAGEAAAEGQESQPVAVPPSQAPPPEPERPPVNFSGDIVEPNYIPQDDIEEILLADTDRPNEPITTGMGKGGLLPPPRGIDRWLPILSEAAMAPDAPQAVRNLFNTVVIGLRMTGEL